MVGLEERVVMPSKKKKLSAEFFAEARSSALALHVGSASADEQSTLSPK